MLLRRTGAHAPRKRTWWLPVGAVILVAWIVIGVPLYVSPPTGQPQPADVLFVLGPPTARVEYAEKLMNAGLAPTIAVSMPLNSDGEIEGAYCEAKRPYRIICFHPEPFTTQGEARVLADMAEEYGWRSANILTSQFHVTRAKEIVGRCYEGAFRMIPYYEDMDPALWAFQYLYQTAAFVKAGLRPGC
ncbi:YdcF family protein [Arthrobacter cavernae]|uniref:YdcF family protein n=1 Tax=Arthrobacter cavernae TaxID=2817681 RepID=A0A939HFZ3_9MICC|nr:ElyC/SanA/YdcF family protein [Arthrobacter cavernae]MBO1267715.1 YdcF family protein [Arthrobacter cavernae]